jgi:INO80 complex subunit C
LKTVLSQERERDRLDREKRRAERMDVDGNGGVEEEDIPTCEELGLLSHFFNRCFLSDLSIEAPPSVLPQRHYCDITGLEVGSLPSLLL